MTNEKVTLPREAVEAIDLCKTQGEIERMVAIVAEKDPQGYERYEPLMRLNLYTLMSALVNGYEVEKSPEEKVREYYVARTDRQVYTRDYTFFYDDAIKTTLDLLGIKIEGVNA